MLVMFVTGPPDLYVALKNVQMCRIIFSKNDENKNINNKILGEKVTTPLAIADKSVCGCSTNMH